ncbi:DUF4363 family protein [Clostridium sp. D2Q-14]|uniref:DUF4363 family protein n=1 Tax=Anaeromonas gelatinilytica TaxID=2683194 RepID=UPI00193B2674|nr:DUF4363 family protein [Anaeromonas gelatinilytica]MBS4535055.1 DUF4363 family protein [Anaeromonas gelatinilytica]
MKIFLFSAILILIIIVGWLFILDYIDKQIDIFIKDLNKVIVQIEKGNWNLAIQDFQDVEKKWNRTRRYWSIILDYRKIDNIDLSITKANKYISINNEALSLGEIEVLKKLFEIVKEREVLTISNIL